MKKAAELSLRAVEVLVAGGGPAGLSAAIAARMAGMQVMVVDPARPPIDKACGEGIMPDGLAALSSLGIELDAATTGAFRGIRFADRSSVVDADFPHGRGIGIRRTALHDVMRERAEELGVVMHWGMQIDSLHASHACVNGQPIHFKWLICADGQNSRLRALSGLEGHGRRSQRIGYREHYRVYPWSEFVEVHWADRGQMYVTPISSEEVCVAFITRERNLKLRDALTSFPELRSRLGGMQPVTRVKGAITTTRSLRRLHTENIALVGEASESVDAVTGEGLSIIFQQAVALAEAMKHGDLKLYAREHARIMRLPRFMSQMMLLLDRSPKFRSRALRAFAAEPVLFRQLLSMHVGAQSPLEFGLHSGVKLGWNLVKA